MRYTPCQDCDFFADATEEFWHAMDSVKGKSCLVCKHFRITHGGLAAECFKKSTIKVALLLWDDTETVRARQRPRRCDSYVDMREAENEVEE